MKIRVNNEGHRVEEQRRVEFYLQTFVIGVKHPFSTRNNSSAINAPFASYYPFRFQTALDPVLGQDIQDPLRRLFLNAAGNNVEITAPTFEASEWILPTVERLIEDDEDLALIALVLLYGNVDADEEDEDTIIAALDAFVPLSTTQPLHASSLSRTLDVLDVHLESGEILSG
ncbi:hypothetical protein BDM02DRAFT_3129315 [Thelephora ganbajun]|uniref:Uncharacterized protein n=1 Tax=Thelephora ganbajun TaxID=370292 RepID=A0ACB6ZF73_THEGA|nr:hypothetical protein BDM02DRAFT_3129315 [Thelephora ganbajun]